MGDGDEEDDSGALKGRQVIVPSSYWMMDKDCEYIGTIGKKARWPYRKSMLEGYEVRFVDGVEIFPTASVLEYLYRG